MSSTKVSRKVRNRPATDASAGGGRSLHGSGDGSEFRVIHRRELKNAPYNPRVIDPVALNRLRDSIRRTKGLVEPPVWNKRTGRIVGGHKRLEALDILKGTDDYTLTVSVVDLSESEEIELNIALNNPNLQGTYDLELLDELLSRSDVEIGNTGFDYTSLEILHLEAGVDLPDWMLPEEDTAGKEEIEELAGSLEELGVEGKSAKVEEDEAGKLASIQDFKRKKAEFKERQGFIRDQNVFCRLVFPSEGTKFLFYDYFQIDHDGELLDGMILLDRLGLKDTAEQVLEDEMPEKMRNKRQKRCQRKGTDDDGE